MPVARISLIAFAPRYQAMAANRLMKMPTMPKIKISVPCGVPAGGAILLAVWHWRGGDLKVVRRGKWALRALLGIEILHVRVGHGQPLLRSDRELPLVHKSYAGQRVRPSKVAVRDSSDDGQHNE